MDKINFQNGITKLNKAMFDTFQNNIDKGKVDKSGDTMTGRLIFENKNEFTGVSKVRTIDGTDYTATLGVGADGSASLELQASSKTLGRIDINKDGKIKNFKTGKYLAELDSTFQNLQLASGISVGSIAQQAKYKKTGGIVSIIGDVAGITAANTTIATLPLGYRPNCQMYFIGTCSGQRFCRWIVFTDGSIRLEWASDGKYDSAWYGLNFSFPIN